MNSRTQIACFVPGIALTGVVFNLIVLVAAPLARPDLDLFQKALSYYAIGPWGVLQAAAFIALAIASIALAAALVWGGAPTLWMCITALMLVVGGLGGLGLVIYPMGEPAPSTMLGDAHQTAGTIGGVAQLAATLAFIVAVRADPRWRSSVAPATIAFAIALLGAVLTQAAIWWPQLGIPMGVVMRLAVVPLVVLWGFVALSLRQRCRRFATRSASAP
jgi:hypothetical protein